MKMHAKKTVCFVLCFLIVSSFLPIRAVQNYAGKHWAATIINKWMQNGVLDVDLEGKINPDACATRAEFVKIVGSIFNYVNKSSKRFSDIPQDKLYFDAVSKAVEAGIIMGSNGMLRPEALISRQEAVCILYRAFGFKPLKGNSHVEFADGNKIAAWSREAVGCFAEKGYISGKGGNLFAPNDIITKAETIKIIDNIVGQLINKAGTASGTVKNCLVVNTGDVILKDMTIEGNLYLTEGIGNGEVTLDNVKIGGDTIIKGGGENSIIINNSSLTGNLLIIKKDGKIRVVAQGSTDIPQVQLLSGAKLQEENLTGNGFNSIELIAVSPGQELKLEGDFASIAVNADDASIDVLDGSVGKLQVEEGAENTRIKIEDGSVEKVILLERTDLDVTGGYVNEVNSETSASGTTINILEGARVSTLNANSNTIITGQGTLAYAIINADGVTLEKKPESIIVGSGFSAVVGNATVTNDNDSSHTPVVPTGSTTTSGGNGGDNGTPPSTPSISITSSNIVLAVDETKPSSVTVNPGDASLSYSCANNAVATVDSSTGEITAVALGTTTITITASKSGYSSGSSTFSVYVSPRTAPGQTDVYPLAVTTGTTRTIYVTFTSTEEQSNETIVFDLPQEFSATTDDYFNISSGPAIELTQGNISNYGKKVTVKNVDLSINHDCQLSLKNKLIPDTLGTYTFTACSDSDGDNNAKTLSAGTGNESTVLSVISTVSDLFYDWEDTTDTAARLSWTPPVGAEKQELFISSDGQQLDTFVKELDPQTENGTVTLTNLTPYTTYRYGIKVTGGKNAGNSNITSFKTLKTPPVLMGDLNIGNGVKIDCINTDWINSLYWVRINGNDISEELWTKSSTGIEIDNSVFVNAGDYSITFYSSDYPAVTVVQSIAPTIISDFSYIIFDNDSAVFMFTKPNRASSVKVQSSLNNTDWTDCSNCKDLITGNALNGNSFSAEVTGLLPNTHYYFRLVVTGGLYAGTTITEVSFTTNGNFKNFIITNWNNTSVDFSFENLIEGFKVQMSSDYQNWFGCDSDIILDNGNKTGKINNLQPNTFYIFRLMVTEGSNIGSSNWLSLTTDGNIQDLVCSDITENTVAVTFKIPSTPPYRVEISTDGGLNWNEALRQFVSIDSNSCTFRITDLTPSTTYIVRVFVESGTDAGSSNWVQFTTEPS